MNRINEEPPDTENWQALPGELKHDHTDSSLTKRQARNRALVLAARMIPHHIEHSHEGRQLLVPPEYYGEALRQLRLHARENRNWPPPPPNAPPPLDNIFYTVTVLALLGLFHDLCLHDFNLGKHRPVDWHRLGNAHADLILDGEWWRAVTALTLHADGVHLLDNIIIGGVFMIWLCRELGGGAGWSLALASGTIGNFLNAWLQHPDHRSVGASTAVFGVLGIAATFNFVRYRYHLGRRQLIPVAAACGLLALLGVGEETTDIGAHLFGFAAGLVLGGITGWLLKRYERPGKKLNGILAIASALIVVLCWMNAIYG